MKFDTVDLARARRSIQGPLWRWNDAVELSSSRDFQDEEHVDGLVVQAARYMQLLGSERDGRSKPADEYPVIATAKDFWDKPENRQQFIILTLADCPREQIAKRFNMEPDVIEMVEKLFFDIRESRKATSWINGHVILPESRSGAVELATKYRAAFWGGPRVAEAILDAGKVCLSDEVQRIADAEDLLRMKALAAADMPLGNSTEARKLLKMHFDHQNKSAALEFRKEKFRFLCEQEIHKRELAEIRQKAAAKREERRMEEMARRRDFRQQKQMERERLARSREHLLEERRVLDEQAKIERAARSPLAQLIWGPGPTAASSSACDSATSTLENTGTAEAPRRTKVAA